MLEAEPSMHSVPSVVRPSDCPESLSPKASGPQKEPPCFESPPFSWMPSICEGCEPAEDIYDRAVDGQQNHLLRGSAPRGVGRVWCPSVSSDLIGGRCPRTSPVEAFGRFKFMGRKTWKAGSFVLEAAGLLILPSLESGKCGREEFHSSAHSAFL